MSVTTEDIRDFVIWLAAPPWQADKMAIGIHLRPTEEQVTLIYGARKALQIMERLPRNSDSRSADIAECRALFDRMLGQCAYENRPKPNAEVDINREDLPALGRAATYLVEFAILKAEEKARDAFAAKQKWARGRSKGYQ